MNPPDKKGAPESLDSSAAGVPSTIRPAVRPDTPALIDLAIATGLLLPDETGFLQEVLDNLHAGRPGAGHQVHVWAGEQTGPPAGVVYFGPNATGERTWGLLWISVAPERQGGGIGGELVRFAEARIREAGGRLVIIDTSSLPRFEATHAFYGKHGYEEVARIPDFYADGDSKVIFAKRMAWGA